MPSKRGLTSSKRESRKKIHPIKKLIRPEQDQEIPSSDEDISSNISQKGDDFFLPSTYNHYSRDFEDDDEDIANLPPEERRLQLAKKYLDKLGLLSTKKQTEHDTTSLQFSLFNNTPAPISLPNFSYLRIPSLNTIGKVKTSPSEPRRGHKASPTSLAIPESNRNKATDTVYTAAKDCAIIQWDLKSDSKLVFSKKHLKPELGSTKDILTLSCPFGESSNLLCSAGADNVVHIWDCRLLGQNSALVGVLKGHRSSITGIAPQPESEMDEILTTSLDNTLKLWSLRTLSYIKTFYGHTAGVLSVDFLANNRPLTVGEDGSARLWKIQEETHFIFRHPISPIDSCTMISHQYFATGNQEGTLFLWSTNNRKPLFKKLNAHGGTWITALVALPSSDLIISAGHDGFIRLWWAHYIVEGNKKRATLTELNDQAISVQGCISELKVEGNWEGSQFEGNIFAAVGKEHRLGRWFQCSTAKSGLLIIPFSCELRG